jgi:hypothetical protein
MRRRRQTKLIQDAGFIQRKRMMVFNRVKKVPGTALIPVDDVIDNLPFIVRPDHRIAAQAKSRPDWASERSYMDDSRLTIHTADKVVEAYQDGEPVG